MKDVDECSTVRTDARITIAENKSVFTVENPNRRAVRTITVDGCLSDCDGRECCDAVLEVGEPCVRVIYVELKGSDLKKAANQLSSSMRLPSLRRRSLGVRRECHIVCSRVTIPRTDLQKLIVNFPKQNDGAVLVVKSRIQGIII